MHVDEFTLKHWMICLQGATHSRFQAYWSSGTLSVPCVEKDVDFVQKSTSSVRPIWGFQKSNVILKKVMSPRIVIVWYIFWIDGQ